MGDAPDKPARRYRELGVLAEGGMAVIAQGVADALTSMRQGVGGAMCGAVRDACTRDFDGSICQAALARYR